eukprot:m.53215 g.53215  ORF g.53215 m.53215 type:complete len:334 (+) comp10849_c0_seq2:5027-6028(+)
MTAIGALNGTRAFFIFFAPMLQSPDWPSAYSKYKDGVVIMNPFNATVENVNAVRETLNSKVLMYWDTGDMQIKSKGRCAYKSRSCDDGEWYCSGGAMPCCYSYNCNAYDPKTSPMCPEDDFARGLFAAFPPSLALNSLGNETHPEQAPICTYGKGPLYVHSNKSVTALVDFLGKWIPSHGFDGVYFDQYFTNTNVPGVIERMGEGLRFSANGDLSKPQTIAEIEEQYNTYRPAFSARLREALGKDAIMIANCGGGMVDPNLNGLTIEACDNQESCSEWFQAQAKVAQSPKINIMWLKGADPQECTIAANLRKVVPNFFEGTDFYDGTHVTCEN